MHPPKSVRDTRPQIAVHIDVAKDIDRFLFFLSATDFRAKRSAILRFYPAMNERIFRGDDEKMVVREMVSDMYKRYESRVEQIVHETDAEFLQSSVAFAALARYMDVPDLGQRSYTAIPTFLPFSPLDQDRFYFSIAFAIARGYARPLAYVAIGVHEISHFIFREQYSAWRQQSSLALNDPAYHYVKEALTAAVMDQPEFRKFFDYQRLFRSEGYPGNPELRDIQVEYGGRCLPIVELFDEVVIHNPRGYLAGLHRLCEAFCAANDVLGMRWELWNDAAGSFENRPEFLETYRRPVQLE